MPFDLSMGELLVLLVVAILLFGGRLPEVARTIGQTIASFKRGMNAEMSRLDLDLRGHDATPYRPARHLDPARKPPEDPEDENCESGAGGAQEGGAPDDGGDAVKQGEAPKPDEEAGRPADD